MDMNIKGNEIFIQIKGIGFTALLDKRMKHNFISPTFLAFFNLGEKQIYSLSKNDTREVNTKPTYDNLLPFLPDYVDSISLDGVFHYIGKDVGKCADNKLRICKVFKFEFVYEECTFSFPFLLDKSLKKPAILGKEAFNRIRNIVMEKKQET